MHNTIRMTETGICPLCDDIVYPFEPIRSFPLERIVSSRICVQNGETIHTYAEDGSISIRVCTGCDRVIRECEKYGRSPRHLTSTDGSTVNGLREWLEKQFIQCTNIECEEYDNIDIWCHMSCEHPILIPMVYPEDGYRWREFSIWQDEDEYFQKDDHLPEDEDEDDYFSDYSEWEQYVDDYNTDSDTDSIASYDNYTRRNLFPSGVSDIQQ